MTEGPPKTAPKILEQQLADLREIQRALVEAREAGDSAAAEALMEQHQDAVDPIETSSGLSLAEAESILGKESVIGPTDIEQVFGSEIILDRIPDIPFSTSELKRAKELGQQLILYLDEMLFSRSEPGMKDGMSNGERIFGGVGEVVKPLTLENLKQKFTRAHDGGKIFYEQDWYKNEDFFKKEKPRVGWRLTSKDLLPESTSKNYLEQTELLVQHIEKEVFKGIPVPKNYANAVREFRKEQPKITSLMDEDWEKASQVLADLAITKLARELPVEAMYRLILNDQARKDKPLPSTYTWTASRASGGGLVNGGASSTRVRMWTGTTPTLATTISASRSPAVDF